MTEHYAEPLQQVDRTYVLWRGRKFSYFAGCDYLRLSSHPAIHKAIKTALDDIGLNVSASRKTTGNHRVYIELENATRRFFGSEAAIISSTGYFTNIIAAQGLRGALDHIFIDERAHGSLRDAAVFVGCAITEFAHLDSRDLAKKVRLQRRRGRVAVLTDGMFSHDGSVAPLAEYRDVIGLEALLWVDDAHAGGIMGKNGRGTIELLGILRRNVLQTVTFSKAFGTYGGAILCEKATASAIVEKSAAVGGNTPLPLPLACAIITGLKICDGVLRKRLFRNIEAFWEELGQPAPAHAGPIVLFAPANPAALRKKLIASGVYPPYIKYPGGPVGGYFRFAISSEHTADQISKLAKVLAPFASTSP